MSECSVTTTPDGYSNIDWKDSDALRALTCALLKEDWQLDVDIPPDRLCPTVRPSPSRGRVTGHMD